MRLAERGGVRKQQLDLLKTKEVALVIDDVANQLGVSIASIRNWIKAGYLIQIGRGTISRSSFDKFKSKIAGQEKLVSRANKSLKDLDNHKAVQHKFHELISEHDHEIDSDTGSKYEEALSNAYRNKEGVYYTPKSIVEKFFQHISKEDNAGKTFCDPCCGSGNFIISAIKYGFKPENIYGFDVDPIAVEITKKRIFKKTGYKTENILLANFLDQSLGGMRTFDIIFTNPPWGKKICKEDKKKYSRIFGGGKSVDTSSLFFFASLTSLKKEGLLGFLLPDAFFNIATFENARKKALSLKIKAFVDFGKPFKGLLTKAKGIILKNTKISDDTVSSCEGAFQPHTRTQLSFIENPKSILNFALLAEEANVIKHIYVQKHLKLVGNAKFGLGIVTGNNKKHCISEQKEGYIPVYRGADLCSEKLPPPSIFIPEDLSLYQQVAPKKLFLAEEKLIYRFISSNLRFYHDTEQSFFLNSANTIVLHDDFPITTKQLSQILNSKIINWLFTSIFETHKILRADIEALPVHVDFFKKYSVFDEKLFWDYLGVKGVENGTFRVKE